MHARAICVAVVALLEAGCAGLRPSQRDDIARWESETARLGHPEVRYEEYLKPSKAMGLGFLPGGGFYVSPGLGISSLVWPFSMIWVPGTAHAKAERFNYIEFRARVFAVRQETQPKVAAPTRMQTVPADRVQAAIQLQRLERMWNAGRISESEYLEQRARIEGALTGEDWDQQVQHPER